MGNGACLAPAGNKAEGSAQVTPEVWQRVKEVLAGALEREPGDRPAYLDQACAEQSLRNEVESLIATHEMGDISFLEQPAIESGALETGTVLGSYEILAPVGTGGMGDVYRAHDRNLNRQVAIKVLSANFAHDPNLLMRFRREAHILASLNHPNIVTIYDIGQDRRTVYIAMELVDGKALDEILAAHAMPTRDVLDIAVQTASGLAVAHESGIVHRDLKPKNVMVRKDGLAKILDFGLSNIAPRSAEKVRVWSESFSPLTEKQLVVLPFTNVGNNPENQGFCDGLVEILSSKLSQLEQFQRKVRVVPSTDVLREGIVSVREARQTFGATLAITGSVQRTENQIRLTINLVDPQTLRQLKSKTIDTETHDISVLQDGVVLEVAELLDVKLSSQAKQVLAVGGTTVPNAYEYYMQGRGYLQRYEVAQNLETAISLFNLALGQDRSYALAEAGLGEAYWRKYEQTKDTQWAEQARKSSAAATGLNDKLAQVYVTLGMIHTGTGRYEEAVQNLQKALVLDPINSDAYRELAKTYQRMGKPKDAES